MDKSEKNNIENDNFLGIKNKKIISILIIVSVIAFAIVIFSIGKNLNNPFEFIYRIDNPVSFTCHSKDDINSVDTSKVCTLIDDQGYRVSFIDENQEIISIINLRNNNSRWPIDVAQYCFKIDNEVYISGYVFEPESINVKSSKLIKCSTEGEYISTICDYCAEGSCYRWIANLKKTNDDIQVVSADNNFHIFVDDFDFYENEYSLRNSDSYIIEGNVSNCFYSVFDDSYLIIDYFGYSYRLFNKNITKIDIDPYIKQIYDNQNFSIKINFNMTQLYKFELFNKTNNTSREFTVSDLFFLINGDKNYLCNTNYVDDNIEIIDIFTGESHVWSEFKYSFQILIYNSIVWISIFYTVILLIFLFISWLRWLSKKQLKRFLNISMGLCIFAAIILTCVFIGNRNYSYIKAEQQNKISAIAQYVSQTHYINDLSPLSFNENKVGKEAADKNIKLFSEFTKDLDSLISSFIQQKQPIHYFIYGYDPDTDLFQYIDSHTDSHIKGDNSGDFDDDYISSIKAGNLVQGEKKTKYSNMLYASMPIYNQDKKIVGIIEVTNILNIMDYILDNIFFEILILLILFIVVLFLVSKEFVSIRQGLKKYRTWHAKKIPHPEIHFMEIMEFLKNFAVSVDSVLCVLISKNMLSQFGLEDNGVLIGLPVAVFGLGSFIGASIFPIFQKNMNVKQVYCISAVAIICTMLLISFTVFINSFLYYVVAKLLFGIAFSILYSSDLTIPMCIDDEKQRFETLRSLALTDVSAPIIAVLACGFLSNVFGNYIIYILGALMGFFVLIIAILFFPSYSRFSNVNKKRKANFKVIFNFFRSPAVISCLIVCLVSFCVGAYKSYLFPLFSNSLNVSNVEISNYFTIASALVFIFSSSLDAFAKRFEHWHNVNWYLIVLAAVFCLFNWNNTLIWAFTAFFISCLIGKGLNAEWKVLWPRKCKLENIDPADMQPVFSIFESICLTLRPIILGAFLGFGSAGACVALGVTCLASCVIFFIFTRNTPLKNNI